MAPQTSKPRVLARSADEFRLIHYYYLIEVTGLISLVFFGAILHLFPQYFPWIGNYTYSLGIFSAWFATHLLFFILREITKKKVLFTIARYNFFFFFSIFILNTGGVESPFFFLLIFPILVSVFDLNERTTASFGILVVSIMLGMLAIHPQTRLDITFALEHAIRISMFALIAYYIYKLVKETLRQRFEKEEINRKFVELSELNRLKTNFVTVVSHQLRTPLSAVRWVLQSIASDTGLSNDNQRLVKESMQRMQYAIETLNQILKSSETGMGGFVLEKKPFVFQDMVAKILEELSYLMISRNVTVRFAKGESVWIEADYQMLHAAIANLIDNAIRYARNGFVDISFRKDRNTITVTIEDNGIGMGLDDSKYAFERFHRGRNAVLVEPNGSGVGLFNARQIIELHGGTITLSSVLDHGTIVTFTIPITQKAKSN